MSCIRGGGTVRGSVTNSSVRLYPPADSHCNISITATNNAGLTSAAELYSTDTIRIRTWQYALVVSGWKRVPSCSIPSSLLPH